MRVALVEEMRDDARRFGVRDAFRKFEYMLGLWMHYTVWFGVGVGGIGRGESRFLVLYLYEFLERFLFFNIFCFSCGDVELGQSSDFPFISIVVYDRYVSRSSHTVYKIS